VVVCGASERLRENVSRDRALAEWSAFRAELQSGRAIDGPLTLRQFVARFYDVIAARHEESTRRTQRNIIKNHLLRYFGDTDLDAITTVRVGDLMADMRNRNCSAAYIGPMKVSSHFDTARRFGGGSIAAGRYFQRFRELREFFVIAVETGLRNQSDLRNLRWEQVELEAGFIRVLMRKTQLEAEIPISSACRQALLLCRARRPDKRYPTARIRRTFALAKAWRRLRGVSDLMTSGTRSDAGWRA
jgi:hypothetical protein